MVCGPIDETFLYYTDNMVKSGANVMIEVQRRGMLTTCFALHHYLGLTTCARSACQIGRKIESTRFVDASKDCPTMRQLP